MKKLISIISLILAVVMVLSGCATTIDLNIGTDENLTIKEVIKLNELEYEDFIANLDSEYSDILDVEIPEFTKATEGENVYYVLEDTSELTIDNINTDSLLGYEEDVEDSMLESLFSVRHITNNDVLLGCSGFSTIASHLKEAVSEISITFPKAITVTNGELSNENKTVTFDGFKRDTNWYAATADSTAPWATAEPDQQETIADEMVDSYLSASPMIYFGDLYNYSSAYLYWEELENADSYLVYKKVGSGNWTLCGEFEEAFGIVSVTPGVTSKLAVCAKSTYWTTEINEYDYIEVTPMNPSTTPSIAVAKAKSGRRAAIKPKTIKGADGYIIYMSKKNKSGTFKKVGKIEIDEASAFYKKLSKGKYYFKVKSFKRTETGTYYSKKASKAKSVTIK